MTRSENPGIDARTIRAMTKAFEARLTQHYGGPWSCTDPINALFMRLPELCEEYDRICRSLAAKGSLRAIYEVPWLCGALGDAKLQGADLLQAIFTTQCLWPVIPDVAVDAPVLSDFSDSALIMIRRSAGRAMKAGTKLATTRDWFGYLSEMAVCASAVCLAAAEIDFRLLPGGEALF
jgi:hypothetical protein